VRLPVSDGSSSLLPVQAGGWPWGPTVVVTQQFVLGQQNVNNHNSVNQPQHADSNGGTAISRAIVRVARGPQPF